MNENDFVERVRLHVLDTVEQSEKVPDAASVANALGRSSAEVARAFQQLSEAHVYVVEPNDPTRLRMANPFSAVPTPFKVVTKDHSYFGNCVWDALGVISLLGGEGRVVTHCPDCRDGLELVVAERRLVSAEGVVHFSVPARDWWENIIYT